MLMSSSSTATWIYSPIVLFSALRPHQWLKNVLVALPTVALHRFDPIPILFAFVSFCMAASAVYLCNDIADIDTDLAHPRKRSRAIASGRIPVSHALAVAVALTIAAGGIAVMMGLGFAVVLGVYLLLAGLYSIALKRVMMLDVVVLAMLYGLRVLAGAEASMITPSHWLVGFCFFLFLCLALCKRIADTHSRPYQESDAQAMTSLMAASGIVSVLTLALYINDAPALYLHPELLWGICLLLTYWLGRICLITTRGKMHDDPVVFAVTDRASWVCGVLTAAIFWLAI